MTYRARRYARAGQGPHSCPDGVKGTWHDLVDLGSGEWVCPYAYDQERASTRRAEREAEEYAARRVKAEQIAYQIMASEGIELTRNVEHFNSWFSSVNPDELRAAFVSAALAGMEAAR